VYVYDALEERIATHERRGQGHRSTDDSHLPEHRRDLRHRSRDYWLVRARVIDDGVGDYVVHVFGSDEVISKLRVVQSIVTLLETFPRERAIAACKRARYYGSHTYAGIRDMLRDGLDFEPLPNAPSAAPKAARPVFSRASPPMVN
jgi:hypothetical protein